MSTAFDSVFSHLPLCSDFHLAVTQASKGDILFCFNNICSNRILNDSILEDIRQKGLRVFLEMPEDCEIEQLDGCWRCVSTRSFHDLPEGVIMAPHCAPVANYMLQGEPLLVAARVAGYDTPVFGLPEDSRTVIAVHESCPGLIVSLIPLSNFLRGRYAPFQRWINLWNGILEMMGTETRLPEHLRPSVDTTFSKEEILPQNALSLCIERAFKMMERVFLYNDDNGVIRVAEGFVSAIREDGSQEWRKTERSDCVIETAAAFGIQGILNGNGTYQELSETIIRRTLSEPGHVNMDITSPCAFQFTFYNGWPIFYSSDNAQTAILLAALQGNADDVEARSRFILRNMVSLLRSTGKNGHRRIRFDFPKHFTEHNWDYYAQEDFINNCPHRQAAVWNLFALGWKLTRHRPFLDMANHAIEQFMSVYPNIKWTNDYTGEIAKMLRPLSFLYRADPTEQHRQWLDAVCDGLIGFMEDCGAMRSSIGPREDGTYPPPSSNQEYGTREASIIQENGDQCCDFLYTQPFAFAGLHEAFIATGNKKYREARDKVASLFIRTQIHSDSHPELDGAWLRAFDYGKWEYWGSSADREWGAWGVESGWTNAPVTMIFSLMEAGKGLYDLMPPDGAYEPYLQETLAELSVVYPINSPQENASGEIIGNETQL